MGKRVISFRLERSVIQLMEAKYKNKSTVMREAINQIIQQGVTKDDMLIALSIPVDEKTRASVKVDEEMLDKLKRIAEENEMPISELVRIAIWKHLTREGAVSSPKPQ